MSQTQPIGFLDDNARKKNWIIYLIYWVVAGTLRKRTHLFPVVQMSRDGVLNSLLWVVPALAAAASDVESPSSDVRRLRCCRLLIWILNMEACSRKVVEVRVRTTRTAVVSNSRWFTRKRSSWQRAWQSRDFSASADLRDQISARPFHWLLLDAVYT
jgi:hypothetical protein